MPSRRAACMSRPASAERHALQKFSSVSGSWAVPTAKSSRADYSAAWVGLGGSRSSSSALEQVGTESDYTGGRATYYACYELVPSPPVTLNLSVRPGDHMSAKVTVADTKVTVSLSNLTTGKRIAGRGRARHTIDSHPSV